MSIPSLRNTLEQSSSPVYTLHTGRRCRSRRAARGVVVVLHLLWSLRRLSWWGLLARRLWHRLTPLLVLSRRGRHGVKVGLRTCVSWLLVTRTLHLLSVHSITKQIGRAHV